MHRIMWIKENYPRGIGASRVVRVVGLWARVSSLDSAKAETLFFFIGLILIPAIIGNTPRMEVFVVLRPLPSCTGDFAGDNEVADYFSMTVVARHQFTQCFLSSRTSVTTSAATQSISRGSQGSPHFGHSWVSLKIENAAKDIKETLDEAHKHWVTTDHTPKGELTEQDKIKELMSYL